MKQDDALNDLSNILGELKGMAIDMGSEIERSVLRIYNILHFVSSFLFLCLEVLMAWSVE